jgi:hypothetical protein
MKTFASKLRILMLVICLASLTLQSTLAAGESSMGLRNVAQEGVTQLTDIDFSQCQDLNLPLTYYQSSTRAYFLAVDSCVQALFEGLGLKPRKGKSLKNKYVNLINVEFGFPNNAFFYSESLSLVFQTRQENNVYRAIVGGLGLKQGYPENPSAFRSISEDIIRRMQLCCDLNQRKLTSCARVNLADYFLGHASYSQCEL